MESLPADIEYYILTLISSADPDTLFSLSRVNRSFRRTFLAYEPTLLRKSLGKYLPMAVLIAELSSRGMLCTDELREAAKEFNDKTSSPLETYKTYTLDDVRAAFYGCHIHIYRFAQRFFYEKSLEKDTDARSLTSRYQKLIDGGIDGCITAAYSFALNKCHVHNNGVAWPSYKIKMSNESVKYLLIFDMDGRIHTVANVAQDYKPWIYAHCLQSLIGRMLHDVLLRHGKATEGPKLFRPESMARGLRLRGSWWFLFKLLSSEGREQARLWECWLQSPVGREFQEKEIDLQGREPWELVVWDPEKWN